MLDVTRAYLSSPGGNTLHSRSPPPVGSIAGERGSALVQVGCSSSPGEPDLGAANAGIAMANIIAVMTRATTTNIMMRLIISATSLTVLATPSMGCSVLSTGSMVHPFRQAHCQNYLFMLLGVPNYGSIRQTSENSTST
jgi:hypothetical protein